MRTPRLRLESERRAAEAERIAPSNVLADGIVGPTSEKGKGPVANVLPARERVRVLAALLDGNDERAVERMTEVNRETVGRLSLAFGRGTGRLHERLGRKCAEIEYFVRGASPVFRGRPLSPPIRSGP
ncbi:hypothetical protein BE21_11435 [Sorangium cellulosum]|uniref:Uncharacterized protein n=1 Tax=Sorangium cellulosum TaxID=56 RepID=A0A150U0Z5_SORCE|nr:hypothetical protein BE21_11435 [Sorangium cellulosum]